MILSPVKSFKPEYTIRTLNMPDTLFGETFYNELADSIFNRIARIKFSNLVTSPRDPVLNTPVDTCIKRIGVGLAVVRFSVVSIQPKGWRSGGPSYERPIRYRAYVESKLSVYGLPDSTVTQTVTAKATAEQPFLYSLINDRIRKKDLISYSSHPYAPPPVRALFKSIKKAFEKLD